jgi:hypothetical protein
MNRSNLIRAVAALAFGLFIIVAISALAGKITSAKAPTPAAKPALRLAAAQPVLSAAQPDLAAAQPKQSAAQTAPPSAPQQVTTGMVKDTSTADVPKPVKSGKHSVRKKTNAPAAAPANDNCANAIAVPPGTNFSDTKDTTNATDEASEPQSTCTLQADSVWYSFTPGVNDASVSVTTCTSAVDTAVMVWEDPANSCNFANFVAVACNDDFCGDGLQSTINFTATAGKTYKIQVGGFDGETGSITTNISSTVYACPSIVINGTLGSGSVNYPSTSGNQTGRLNRNGISSTCAAAKTCMIFDPANARAYDAYTIPNHSGAAACTTVTLDVHTQAAANYQVNAYLDTYNGALICANYLADPGLSSGSPPSPVTMSFVVPAGHSVVLVVHTTNPGETGGSYTLTVQGNLCGACDIKIANGVSPAGGYLPLSTFSIAALPGVDDDTVTFFNTPAYTFGGETYTQLGFSSNGIVVMVGNGATGAGGATFVNQNLPDPGVPNNVLAPFWTDLNPGGGGAMRIATLTDGTNSWIVADWDAVKNLSSANTDSFEIWIGFSSNTPPGQDVTYAYGPIQGNGNGGVLTVGAENKAGTSGQMIYYNGSGTLPASGTQLRVTASACVGISTQASAGVFLGGAISDTATIVNGINNPGGTITFRAYGPNDSSCGGAVKFTSSVPVTGNGNYSSGPYTPTAAGTYRWTASYSGDASNNPASTACNDPNESVLVRTRSAAPTPTPTPTPTPPPPPPPTPTPTPTPSPFPGRR